MPIVEALPEHLLLLDNDVFSGLRNESPTAKNKVRDYFNNLGCFPALPSVIIFETFMGVEAELKRGKITEAKAEDYKNRIRSVASQYQILSVNDKAAEIAAYIVISMGDKKIKKYWRDLCIAATALAHGYGVATGNRKDFELISEHLSKKIYPFLRLSIWKP